MAAVRPTLAYLILGAALSLAMADIELAVFDSGFVLVEPSGDVTTRSAAAIRKRQTTDVEDLTRIENTLNNLRRSVHASNMYYANWDYELEQSARSHVNSCSIRTDGNLDPKFRYALGFTGYRRTQFSLSDQLRSIYNVGVIGSSFYRQLMSSRLTQFACVDSAQDCVVMDQTTGYVIYAKIFACIFAYKSDPISTVLYKSGTNCSQCDNDTLWCDAGLCRGTCSLKNPSCDTCKYACFECDSVTYAQGDCDCICYYADGSQRCTAGRNVPRSASQPICHAPVSDERTEGCLGFGYGLGFPIGWLVCIIIASLLILAAVLGVISRCVVQRRRARRARETNIAPAGNSNIYDFGPNFVPVTSPPPYIDSTVKPPPYDNAIETDQKDAQPTASESVNHAYDNIACTADEVQI